MAQMHRTAAFLFVVVVLAYMQQVDANVVNGVAMGGWLLMETAWMFDQFNAPAENDYIRQLREQHNDTHAYNTMRNHWFGYHTQDHIQTLASFGITRVRVLVGYWIVDVPSVPLEKLHGSPTMYDAGFNHEGFATGGIAALERMLTWLKQANMTALIDLHAPPGGGSRCQSYSGWQVSDYENSFWQGGPTGNASYEYPACSGAGPYTSTRPNNVTWQQLAVDTLKALASWAVEMNGNLSTDVVRGIEIVNEPALGWPGHTTDVEAFVEAAVPQVQDILKKAGMQETIAIVLNFIGPNDQSAGQWVASKIRDGTLPSNTVVDYHNYYNWDGSLSMQQLLDKVCSDTAQHPAWQQYSQQHLPVMIGEWSLASNLGDPRYNNISVSSVRDFLQRFYAVQVSMMQCISDQNELRWPRKIEADASCDGVAGQFYWTARMGSGWNPEPTPSHPNGHQVPGTAADRSLASFGSANWNFLELIRTGIAVPSDQLDIQGVCKCRLCA